MWVPLLTLVSFPVPDVVFRHGPQVIESECITAAAFRNTGVGDSTVFVETHCEFVGEKSRRRIDLREEQNCVSDCVTCDKLLSYKSHHIHVTGCQQR